MILVDEYWFRSVVGIDMGVLRKDTQGGALETSDSVALDQESCSAAKDKGERTTHGFSGHLLRGGGTALNAYICTIKWLQQ